LDGAAGQWFVPIHASIVDDGEIVSYECLVDGEPIARNESMDCSWDWFAYCVNSGLHSIAVRASDGAGNYALESVSVSTEVEYFMWFWNNDPTFTAKLSFGQYEVTASAFGNTPLSGVLEGNYYVSVYIYSTYYQQWLLVGSDWVPVDANTWFTLFWDWDDEVWYYTLDYTGGCGDIHSSVAIGSPKALVSPVSNFPFFRNMDK